MAQRRALPATRDQAILDVENPDYGRPVAVFEPPAAIRAADANPDDIGNLPEADELGALGRVLDELDSSVPGANVKIWRLNPKAPTEKVFVDEISPQDFGLKWLMDNYGGGRYRIMVYVPQRDPDTGEYSRMKSLAANKVLDVDGPAKVRREEPLIAAPVAVQNNNELLMAGFGKIAEGMTSGFQQLAGMIATGNKPPTMTEMLQQMVMMKQVLGGGTDPMAMMTSVLGMVKTLEETRALSAGGGDDGDGGGDGITGVMLSKFMDLFADHAKRASAGNNSPPLVTGDAANLDTLFAPEDAPAVAPPIEDDEGDDDMNTLIVKLAVKRVLTHARRNTPVKDVAAEVYPALTNEFFTFLKDDNWRFAIEAFDERAKLYPPYLEQLRTELLRLDAEDESGEAV